MPPIILTRSPIKGVQLEEAIGALRNKIAFRFQQKGNGSAASRHEIFGLVAEEMDELVDALRGNNMDNFAEELLDVAVGCIFGYACVKAKTLDW